MKKDAFYFPHFCNARHDRKIKRVLKELGIEGYGIYFMLLEVLREQTDFRYPLSEIDLLADEFGTSEQKVRVVICNYGLFEIDENEMLFSLKLIEFLQPYLKMKEQRSLAGKSSAEKRKQLTLNDRSTTVEQSKVNKVNKVKETKETTQSTPEFEEFKNFAVTHKSTIDLNALKLKYNSWVENGWKNGNNKPIKNWKSTLLNTIPYIKERQKDPEPIKGIKLGMK